jgi:hypothetical protein
MEATTMIASTSSRELPEKIKKSVEEALKRANIKEPAIREWDIIGFILREELAHEGLEAVAQKAQQIASHVGGASAGAQTTAGAAAAGPHPVAGFLPNKRIICGFIQDPAILQR